MSTTKKKGSPETVSSFSQEMISCSQVSERTLIVKKDSLKYAENKTWTICTATVLKQKCANLLTTKINSYDLNIFWRGKKNKEKQYKIER